MIFKKSCKSLLNKRTVYLRGKEISKESIIISLRNLFILKKENKEIKDRIIRDTRILFEYADDY